MQTQPLNVQHGAGVHRFRHFDSLGVNGSRFRIRTGRPETDSGRPETDSGSLPVRRPERPRECRVKLFNSGTNIIKLVLP